METMKRLLTIGLLAVLALGAAGIGFVAGQGQTEEVRVNARSLANGKIEFAIEHDGERLLPTGRFLTVALKNAGDGKWLRSTPVEIEVGGAELTEASSSASEHSGTYSPVEIDLGTRGAATYAATRDRFTKGIHSFVSVYGVDGYQDEDGVVGLHCYDTGELVFIIADLPAISEDATTVDIEIVVDDGDAFAIRAEAGTSQGGNRNLYYYDWRTGDLAAAMRNGDTLYLQFAAERRLFNGEFDITDFFRTPVQANLENCGN